MIRFFLLSLFLTVFAIAGMAQDSSDSAEVTLVEYSDYQCPACAHFHPIVEQLKEEFGDRLEIEYRHFPLNSHQHAALAARAVEAAKNQDRFMEMHNLLFENQNRWSGAANAQSIFIEYADELDLDVSQFREDLNSGETQRTVMEQKEEGQQLGVNSTPTFFLNDEKVEQNPPSYEEFKKLVSQYLE